MAKSRMIDTGEKILFADVNFWSCSCLGCHTKPCIIYKKSIYLLFAILCEGQNQFQLNISSYYYWTKPQLKWPQINLLICLKFYFFFSLKINHPITQRPIVCLFFLNHLNCCKITECYFLWIINGHRRFVGFNHRF